MDHCSVRFALLPAYGRKGMGDPHRIAKPLAQPSPLPSEIVLELVLGLSLVFFFPDPFFQSPNRPRFLSVGWRWTDFVHLLLLFARAQHHASPSPMVS